MKKAVTRNNLTVVMPAYNEEDRVKHNLLYTADILGKFEKDYCIIAVNDGSKDGTKEEILKACEINNRIRCISYSKNRGKGYAIKRGIVASDARYVAYLDSDLELAPEMLEKYMDEMHKQNADVVIGSKMHKDSKLEYPLLRKVLSYGYYVYLKLLFHLKLKDVQTGIKLFRSDKIKPIVEKMDTSGFAFDIEILATASEMGLKIIEMPVKLNYTKGKEGRKSKISIRVIFNMFADAIKIKRKINRQLRDKK